MYIKIYIILIICLLIKYHYSPDGNFLVSVAQDETVKTFVGKLFIINFLLYYYYHYHLFLINYFLNIFIFKILLITWIL